MSAAFGAFLGEVAEKIGATEEGDRLLTSGSQTVPRIELVDKIEAVENLPAPMVFCYPNTIQVIIQPLPRSGDYKKTENPHFEAQVALALVHELLHRKQAKRRGISAYFKGHLHPFHTLSAQLLIEADNYARTAQVGWRMAHMGAKPYTELGDYMRSVRPEDKLENSFRIYAAAMKEKPITPENELIAMRAVADDFLFKSTHAQDYTHNLVAGWETYLKDNPVIEKMAKIGNPPAARKWLKTQTQMRGFGPDRVEYCAADFTALGKAEGGNVFDLGTNTMKNLSHPLMAEFFMTEGDMKSMQAVGEYATLIAHICSMPGRVKINKKQMIMK